MSACVVVYGMRFCARGSLRKELQMITRRLPWWSVVASIVLMLAAQHVPAGEPAKPLISVLPDDAMVVVWAPNTNELFKVIVKFMPDSAGVEIPQVPDFLPKETLNLPAAIVIMPPVDVEDDPEPPMPVFLLTVPNLADIMKNGADDDGLFGAFDDDLYIMQWKGYAAVGMDRETLLAFKALPDKAFAPSPDAAKLITNAQVFAHVNMPLVMQTYETTLRDAAEDMTDEMGDEMGENGAMWQGTVKLMFDFYIAAGKQIASVDAAGAFDREGVKVSCVVSIKKESKVAPFLLSIKKIDKPDMKLPVLERYCIAAWSNHDAEMFDKLLGMLGNLMDANVKKLGLAPELENAWMPKIKSTMEGFRGTAGEQSGFVMSLTEEGIKLASIDESRKPEQFNAMQIQMLSMYYDIMTEVMKMAPEEARMEMKAVHEPGAKTFGGVKFDQVKTVMTAGSPEVQAHLDQMMLMYGPEGISILTGVVGDKAVSGLGDDAVEKAVAVLQGKAVPLLNTEGAVKKVLAKIEPDHSVKALVVPVRFVEWITAAMWRMWADDAQMPNPTPFASPAAIGAKITGTPETGPAIYAQVYFPQACIPECISAFMAGMGRMMGRMDMEQDVDWDEADDDLDEENAEEDEGDEEFAEEEDED